MYGVCKYGVGVVECVFGVVWWSLVLCGMMWCGEVWCVVWSDVASILYVIVKMVQHSSLWSFLDQTQRMDYFFILDTTINVYKKCFILNLEHEIAIHSFSLCIFHLESLQF